MTSSVSPDIFSDTTVERRYRISQEIERLRRDNELAALNLMADIEGQTPLTNTLERTSLVPSDQSVRAAFLEMSKGMKDWIFAGFFGFFLLILCLVAVSAMFYAIYLIPTSPDFYEVPFALKAFLMVFLNCVVAASAFVMGFIVFHALNQALADFRAFKKYGAKNKEAWNKFSHHTSKSVVFGGEAIYVAEFDGEKSSARAIFFDAIGHVYFDSNIATNEKNQIIGRDGRDIFVFPDLKRMHGDKGFVEATDSLWKTAFKVAGDRAETSQTAEK